MKNINILDCYFDQDDLINIQNESKLTIKGGYISNNYGKGPVFKLQEKCTLELIDTTFERNKNSSNKLPTCIESDKKSIINIKGCEFLNHNYSQYQISGKLIVTKGYISIISSKFKNNKTIDIRENFHIISTNVILFVKSNTIYHIFLNRMEMWSCLK